MYQITLDVEDNGLAIDVDELAYATREGKVVNLLFRAGGERVLNFDNDAVARKVFTSIVDRFREQCKSMEEPCPT